MTRDELKEKIADQVYDVMSPNVTCGQVAEAVMGIIVDEAVGAESTFDEYGDTVPVMIPVTLAEKVCDE
jgi:hypothetical protein